MSKSSMMAERLEMRPPNDADCNDTGHISSQTVEAQLTSASILAALAKSEAMKEELDEETEVWLQHFPDLYGYRGKNDKNAGASRMMAAVKSAELTVCLPYPEPWPSPSRRIFFSRRCMGPSPRTWRVPDF